MTSAGNARRRHSRFRTGMVLRCLLVLWLTVYIVYTPLHLILESHSDDIAYRHAGSPGCVECAVSATEHDSDHHQAHPAAQHHFKSTQPVRITVGEMMPVTVVAREIGGLQAVQPAPFGFSGLSPPEFHHSWQFIYRAAVPVRAPSSSS